MIKFKDFLANLQEAQQLQEGDKANIRNNTKSIQDNLGGHVIPQPDPQAYERGEKPPKPRITSGLYLPSKAGESVATIHDLHTKKPQKENYLYFRLPQKEAKATISKIGHEGEGDVAGVFRGHGNGKHIVHDVITDDKGNKSHTVTYYDKNGKIESRDKY